ncbi:hypothetical protein FGO68_gene17352 [Halteria grandinella]|uniref:Uncharacterized protein n=1 Tax=Halteria grandinella TaxID=5974 RepID=A0A8J8NPH2_HALGN|nr:hypothetical protein FGO68_gene17352 [Halteria grandinella]
MKGEDAAYKQKSFDERRTKNPTQPRVVTFGDTHVYPLDDAYRTVDPIRLRPSLKRDLKLDGSSSITLSKTGNSPPSPSSQQKRYSRKLRYSVGNSQELFEKARARYRDMSDTLSKLRTSFEVTATQSLGLQKKQEGRPVSAVNPKSQRNRISPVNNISMQEGARHQQQEVRISGNFRIIPKHDNSDLHKFSNISHIVKTKQHRTLSVQENQKTLIGNQSKHKRNSYPQMKQHHLVVEKNPDLEKFKRHLQGKMKLQILEGACMHHTLKPSHVSVLTMKGASPPASPGKIQSQKPRFSFDLHKLSPTALWNREREREFKNTMRLKMESSQEWLVNLDEKIAELQKKRFAKDVADLNQTKGYLKESYKHGSLSTAALRKLAEYIQNKEKELNAKQMLMC